MTDGSQDLAAYEAKARELLSSIEAGDGEAVGEALDELTRLRETELFREVGKLTRELHEALKSFRLDGRLSDIAVSEIPDAHQRLNHVIELTENSAHRTLTALEESLETLSGISSDGKTLAAEWKRFRSRQLSATEFRGLGQRLDQFFERLETEGDAIQEKLTDALMAQDYQDLTGQIIRRVMDLVREVEDGLVSLISISAPRQTQGKATEDGKSADKNTEDAMKLEGPQVPGQESDSAVSGQDEVDDLLSSLGF
ncbi:protein phosphatase CheZ [Aquisalimonas asiatica]|uniref:Protein phosphatase CheZ n=1 Tax=Aquisalimonas asiatica TaxID=406100 RepID=A0A1H8QST8_9GAMM|nr:protein phosphatase CheZ [Aquisalimonas asiatica]SEO57001.1 chemotaxis phosphatase, CheZ [Aquisalimonas asiatica]